MKNPSSLQPACVAACVLGVLGASGGAARADDPSISRNRINIGATFGFNVSATIRNHVVAAPAGPIYDDGYVAPDISGSALKTWNWGFTNPNQVQGGNLDMHSASSPRDGSQQQFNDDSHPGFDLSYGRELGRFHIGRHAELPWGVMVGFSSTDLDLRSVNTMSGIVPRQTYPFALGGTVPPLTVPYNGTFAGPGPLIAVTPGALPPPDNVAVSSTLASKITGLAYGLKIGPFIELPIWDRFYASLGAGIMGVNADLQFDYTETTSLVAGGGATGGPPATRTATLNHSEWLFGPYATASLAYRLSETMSVFLGGQYENLGSTTISGAAKDATVKLGQFLQATAGIRFTF